MKKIIYPRICLIGYGREMVEERLHELMAVGGESGDVRMRR